LFTLIINTFMLYLVTFLDRHFHVGSFWPAFWSVVVIGIVNYLLNDIIDRGETDRKHT
jgi:uncharacterized membrane protein YvlD (DUF360 family)